MTVWGFDSRSLVAVALAAMALVMLGGCEQASEENVGDSSPKSEATTVTAPGVITGNEALPAGHPPIEGLQAAAAAAPSDDIGGVLPSNHSPMLGGDADTAGVRPDDEPEHPPSSGKELAVVIPDSVKGKWSSVQLETSLADGSKKTIRTILGEETQLPDPSLTVRAEIFLPAYMSDFETIKSASNELMNPAVKLRLFKDQKEVAVGWIFQNYPEFNSFKSEWVTFQLLSAEAVEMH